MKTLEELTPADLAQLKVGDEVETVAERSPEFRYIPIDGCVVLPSPPWHMTLSLNRMNPRRVTTTATVMHADAGILNLSPKSTQAQAGLMEEAQLRLTPDAAGDIALNLLTALLALNPVIFQQKIDANPLIKQALTADAGV